jgi:hypothetical protein
LYNNIKELEQMTSTPPVDKAKAEHSVRFIAKKLEIINNEFRDFLGNGKKLNNES